MKKYLFIAGILGLGFSAMSCGGAPEIASVLEDYCDYKVNTCDCKATGTEQYCAEDHNYSRCDKFHKDLLEATSDGEGASSCRGDVEDFFIILMKSQMNGACNKPWTESLAETEVSTQMAETLSCLEANGVDVAQTVADLMTAITGSPNM